MADPLRKPVEPLVSDDPLEIAALPGAPPAYDESEVRRMKRESRPALVNAAETVGSTVGSAVGTLRDKVHSGLEVVKKRSADKGMNIDELNETVRTRANEAAENIRARTNEVTEATSRRIREWSGATQRRIEMLRTRGKEFSRERPAELILVIGGIAMVAGIIMRLWRSNRD